jgi:hypothetical protein
MPGVDADLEQESAVRTWFPVVTGARLTRLRAAFLRSLPGTMPRASFTFPSMFAGRELRAMVNAPF